MEVFTWLLIMGFACGGILQHDLNKKTDDRLLKIESKVSKIERGKANKADSLITSRWTRWLNEGYITPEEFEACNKGYYEAFCNTEEPDMELVDKYLSIEFKAHRQEKIIEEQSKPYEGEL